MNNNEKDVMMFPEDQEDSGLQVVDKELMAMTPEQQIKHFADKVKVWEGMKGIAISRTHSGDWVDQDGKPYLMSSGIEKIRQFFDLMIYNVRRERETFEHPADGPYYVYTVTGVVATKSGIRNEYIGTCSSRHKLFAKRGDTYLPMGEVDVTNIIKADYTNFVVNGISRTMGLRNLTWDELAQYGIKQSGAVKVGYVSGKKSSKWTDEQEKAAHRIREFLLANVDGDTKKAREDLAELTKWKDKNGKEVAGKTNVKDLTGKQIGFLFDKLKKQILEFEGSGEKDVKQPEPTSSDKGEPLPS